MNKNITIYTYELDNLLFSTTTSAFLEDNILKFYTDNDSISINLEKFTFTKKNNESIFKLTNDLCTINLLNIKKTFEIPIKYLNFNYTNNEIIIEYFLESQENPLKIKIIIGSDINEL